MRVLRLQCCDCMGDSLCACNSLSQSDDLTSWQFYALRKVTVTRARLSSGPMRIKAGPGKSLRSFTCTAVRKEGFSLHSLPGHIQTQSPRR